MGTMIGVANAISRARQSTSKSSASRSAGVLTGITARCGLCPSNACGSTDCSASPRQQNDGIEHRAQFLNVPRATIGSAILTRYLFHPQVCCRALRGSLQKRQAKSAKPTKLSMFACGVRRRVLCAMLPIMASISRTIRSGAAYCTMWPTPGNTISFAFGTAAANGREWMFGPHGLVGIARDHHRRRLDIARSAAPARRTAAFSVTRSQALARNSRGRSSNGVAVSSTKPSGMVCGRNTPRAPGSVRKYAERQRDGIGQQRADHRRGDDLVVPADAAAPRIGHRRQHHQAGDALRIIQRHPRAERAGPGMHHEDRVADAELFQRLVDHPALDRRRRIWQDARACSSHGRDDRSGSPDDCARADRRAAAAWSPDSSSRHGSSRSAARWHRAARYRARGAWRRRPRSSGPAPDRRAAGPARRPA